MNQITVECKNITKNFKTGTTELQILRGINLTAYENELILLMGPSGSGKSTLLSIIGGIMNQTSGECLVLNKSINQLPEEEKTRFRGKNIGFLFQNFNLIPTLNNIENAALPLILNGWDEDRAMEESAQLLEKMGLDEQRYRNPRDISGGEQQRVAIARACIHKPKIMLCDEPTSFLDHERGKQVMSLLHDIKKENACTLIVVTHDPRILEFGDRILHIEDGVIINDQTTPHQNYDSPLKES